MPYSTPALVKLKWLLIPKDHISEFVLLVSMAPLKALLEVGFGKCNGRLSLATNKAKGAANGADVARGNIKL